MKYILKEYPKFILAEKFILTEARYSKNEMQGIKAEYETVLQDFIKVSDEAKEKINSLVNNAPATADDDILDLLKLADTITSGNVTSTTDIKTKAKQYVTNLDKKLKSTPGYNESKHPAIAKAINSLNKFANEPNKTAIKDEADEARIIHLVKETVPIIRDIMPLATKIVANDKLVKEKLKTITDNLTKLVPAKEDIPAKINNNNIKVLLDIENILENVSQSLSSFNAKDDINEEDISSLETALTKAINNKESAKKAASDATKLSANKKIDAIYKADDELVQLLKDAQNDPAAFREALKSILNMAFNNDSQLVKKALELNSDGAITEEILYLGATPKVNPFLAFIANNRALILDSDINSKKYAVLHNRYIRENKETFTGEDLRGIGVLSKCDLIFSKSFYDVDTDTMDEYLDWRAWVLKNKNRKFVNTALADKYSNDTAKFFNDLFYKEGQLFSKQSLPITYSLNRELKSLTQIMYNIDQCFGDDVTKPNSKQAISVDDKLISGWIDQLGRNKDKIAKLILAIKLKAATKKAAEIAKNLMKNYSECQNVAISDEESDQFTNLLNNIEIKEQNVKDIITSVASLGKLTKLS